jgi:hypothetical protein
MDDLVGKDVENVVSVAFLNDEKFRNGTFEFQRSHGAISEDHTVPADIATVVTFRHEVIRRRMERHKSESQLTVFICGNLDWDVCAGG